MPTRITVVGATGSIGCQALELIERFPEEFQLVGAVGGRRAEALTQALLPFPDCRGVVVNPDGGGAGPWAAGSEAVLELVSAPEVDMVLVAGGGAGSLLATLAACRAGHAVAIATKEVLVMAGELVTETARRHGAPLIPVDSEHSAIWQCLRGEDPRSVSRLILTASGGPVRDLPLAELAEVTPARALAHPNWDMGPKVTVDSATMVNKGLEVIEAHFLFGVPYPRIEVVIQPQSAIHSAVEFVDGSTIAQLGVPDMRVPISLAMTQGRRLPGVVAPLQLSGGFSIDFREVEPSRYPALGVVRAAGSAGGTSPCVVNAANEVAVDAFLAGRINFPGIAALLESVLMAHDSAPAGQLEAVLEADRWARRLAEELIARPVSVA